MLSRSASLTQPTGGIRDHSVLVPPGRSAHPLYTHRQAHRLEGEIAHGGRLESVHSAVMPVIDATRLRKSYGLEPVLLDVSLSSEPLKVRILLAGYTALPTP